MFVRFQHQGQVYTAFYVLDIMAKHETNTAGVSHLLHE